MDNIMTDYLRCTTRELRTAGCHGYSSYFVGCS